MNSSTISNDHVILLHQRLQRAVKRINSVVTCPSSVAAEEFLCQWDVDDFWKSLPQRLGLLAERVSEQELLPAHDEEESNFPPRVAFSSAIFSRVASSRSLEKHLISSFQRLFSLSLEAFDKRWRERNQTNDMLTEDDEDNGEIDYDGNCDSFFSSLRKLGWLPSCSMVHKALRMALYDVNERTIRKLICSRYESYGMWGAVLDWKKNVLGPWLFQKVLNVSMEEEEEDYENWKQKIDLLVATSFVTVRMEELFTIITEYPDSKPAVEELREAIAYSTTPAQRMRLATSLKENLQRRLLHPGANTAQILDVYISAIKVLRTIDADGNHKNSSGQQQLLLETVTEPIKKYLRARSDTVRCIILGLTDEKAGGDLYEELRRQDATLLETGYESDDDEDPPDPNWMPSSTPQQQALAAALASHTQSGKTTPTSASDRKQQQRPQEDILSMLVNIYGSQELFVNEYRLMLSDKLLANLDFDTDKEVHTLELLKLRFGETSLRQCEIMIKDIDDSKRIVSNIYSTIAAQRESRDTSMVVDAAIVSHIFWPPLLKEDMKAHPKIQSQLDLFGKEYANLKNPRKLIWLHQLGTVTVELEFRDDEANHGKALPKGFPTKKEFTCSPIQATLITHFGDKDTWTAMDLARETNVSEETIRRKMGYWLNQRVVQCRDTILLGDGVHGGGRHATVLYTLCSSFLSGDAFHEQSGSSFSEDGVTEIMAEYDEDEDNAIQAKAQEAEEMKVYESYITGMLTNLGPLPLERIHNMLKMFVTGSEHKYDKTPQELSSFLDYLCNQDKLEYSDRMYKLVKK